MWSESLSPLCIQVRLEWPTDLAINPMDNSIYVLDNNVVLQITENRQVMSIRTAWSMHNTSSNVSSINEVDRVTYNKTVSIYEIPSCNHANKTSIHIFVFVFNDLRRDNMSTWVHHVNVPDLVKEAYFDLQVDWKKAYKSTWAQWQHIRTGWSTWAQLNT